MCAKYALPSSVFMPSIIPYFPPHGKPFSVPRSYRLNAALLGWAERLGAGKCLFIALSTVPLRKKPPPTRAEAHYIYRSGMLRQACLRRRRVANPASASRDSVAVVGSGTVYVILSPLRGVRCPLTVSPVRVRVREAPSAT